MEDWGEEIFAEGVGVKWKNERVGRGRERKITIKDGGIKSLIYLEFRSKITPALQATSSETQGQIARQGKCKRAKENGDEEKHSMARRAPGDKFLPDQFQTVEVILNSDRCQKFFVFFCPIRGQEAVKSFRVFLHGNHLIAILAWFIWQGFAQGEKSQSQHKMYRKSFRISAGNTLDLLKVSLQSRISRCARFV